MLYDKMRRQRVTLVTGAIASGKSEVCRYLASLGYPVYDSDSRVKALYDTVPGLKSLIERELGIPFNELSLIFRDESLRLRLESIVYPLLHKDFECWCDSCAETDASKRLFFESAIALDKFQFDDCYDDVLLVRADAGLRLGRNPKVSQRDSLQSFDLSKVNYIIENNTTITNLHALVDKYLRETK